MSGATDFPLDSGRRFYIQNSPSLLNSSGEWIYDPTAKKIVFIPPENEAALDATASPLPNILVANGASHLTFKNISFRHSSASGVIVKNSENITLDQLNVDHVGGTGVELVDGNNNNIINGNIHHTGGAGIVSFGGDRKTLQASGHLISGNQIHHMASTILMYAPRIRLYGVGTKVTHNLLEEGAGSAIIIGGNERLIEKMKYIISACRLQIVGPCMLDEIGRHGVTLFVVIISMTLPGME